MLIDANKSCLLVVDIQTRLSPAMSERERVLDNGAKLMTAASEVGVPMLVSEQYPKGIGPTEPAIAALAPEDSVVEKIHFSCLSEPSYVDRFRGLRRDQAVVFGIESHVCVLQTVSQLVTDQRAVFVVADACSSRDPANHDLAMRRMQDAGAEIVSTEMVLFEWMGRAGTDTFRTISALIK